MMPTVNIPIETRRPQGPTSAATMVEVVQSTGGVEMHRLIYAVAVVLPLSAADVRLTNDIPEQGGYISAYSLATGMFYSDPVIKECSKARGRQNEPAVAMNPRDSRVLIGSSNDYCGTY